MDIQNLPWWGQFLVFLIIGAILFVVFYLMVYSKNISVIEKLETDIAALEREIKIAEQKKDKMPMIKQEIEEKEQVLQQLKQILPEEKEITQILKKIESLIQGNRLRLNSFVQRGVQQREIYVEHPYALRVEGNFHNLAIFFDQLSKLKKIFTINRLTLAPRKNMTRDITVGVGFNATTYTYKEAPKRKPKARRKRRRR